MSITVSLMPNFSQNSNNVKMNRVSRRINYVRNKSTVRLEELMGKKDQASVQESRTINQFLKDLNAKWDMYTTNYKEFQELTWKFFKKDSDVYKAATQAI